MEGTTAGPVPALHAARDDATPPLRIGFTFDLRSEYEGLGYSREALAEFEAPETVDAISETLTRLGHRVERIGGLPSLATRLVRGERWDLVFNICEGMRGFGREAAVPALLDAYDIPYTFSDPLSLTVTLHKATTKRVARAFGVPTPDFHVVESMADVGDVDLRYPLFAKPVAEGSSKGVHRNSLLRDRHDLERTCRHLLEMFRQPVLVEEHLPGREFTVGLLGSGRHAQALGAIEISTPAEADHGYTFELKNVDWIGKVEYRLATDAVAAEACEVALQAWRAVDGRDCGRVDVRCDRDGRVNLVEVNSIPGLRPNYSDICVVCNAIGVEYPQLISRIVASAARRIAHDGVVPSHARAG